MKQVRELHQELFDLLADHGIKHDHRFAGWIKPVTGINPAAIGGYMFKGDFLSEGTIEISAEPQVFLACTVTGSRKYHTRAFNVITMNSQGELELTDIQTTDKTNGWALRIRDQIADLLALRHLPRPKCPDLHLTALGLDAYASLQKDGQGGYYLLIKKPSGQERVSLNAHDFLRA